MGTLEEEEEEELSMALAMARIITSMATHPLLLLFLASLVCPPPTRDPILDISLRLRLRSRLLISISYNHKACLH